MDTKDTPQPTEATVSVPAVAASAPPTITEAQPASSTASAPATGRALDAASTAALTRAAGGATPLAHQVAGHAGVMSDESGSLVMKPALPREIAFYQLVASAPRSSAIAQLKPFLPKFYGTLRLEGQVGSSGSVEALPGANEVPESVVLENLAYPFTHPCILDAKLGTVLHGPDATPEKAARMIVKAKNSTIGSMGMRLTGCQTWHADSQSYIQTTREFGYELTAERLPEGMVRFFPLPDDKLVRLDGPPPSPTPSGGGVSGAGTPGTHTPAEADAQHDHRHAEGYTGHALPAHLTQRVLQLVDEELGRLSAALRNLELRAVGASVLIVYEGDPTRLAQAFERYDARRVSLAAKSLASPADEDSSDDEDGSSSESSSSSSSDDEDDGVAGDERRARRCPPLVVRLIDFAHTWLVAGEGPDEGVLLGLQSLRGLVQGRLREVETWIARQHEGQK